MYDSIIIGCGPAGMTSALYLLRAGKSVLLLEREGIGGQIAKSPRLENYPSIKSISGDEFSNNLFEQVTELGAQFEFENAISISKIGEAFLVKGDYSEFEGRTVVLATGCHHRKLGLPREDELVGHGISYCATCDGAFFKGQDVIVVGDANTALQYSLLLSDLCVHVQICTLFGHFFADDILVKRIKERENVSYRHNLSAKEYLGDKEIEGMTFVDTQAGDEVTYKANGVFICIGQQPDNERFSEFVELNDQGFIVTDENMATKTPGVFAVGDCRAKSIRQVVTATNDGATAAIAISKYLN